MSQELYFFKFKKEHASVNLKRTLFEGGQNSFLNYFQKKKENSQKYNPISSSFETIIQKVETNVELITLEELELIFYWFYERNTVTRIVNNKTMTTFSELIFGKDLLKNGIELFFEDSNKTPIRQFCNVAIDYYGHYKIDVFDNCDSLNFMDFLNYLFTYSCELMKMLNIHYYQYVDCVQRNNKITQEISKIENNEHNVLYVSIQLQKEWEEFKSTISILRGIKRWPSLRAKLKKDDLRVVEQKWSDYRTAAFIDDWAVLLMKGLKDYNGKVKVLLN